MKNLFLAIMFLVLLIPTLHAQEECVDCPECSAKVAVGLLKKTSKKKTVYEVSTKEIAVPDICLPRPIFNLRAQLCELFRLKACPGDPCCGCKIEECPKQVRCGQIRCIKVFKKSSVKCDACAYQWEVTEMEKVDEYLYGKPENQSATTLIVPKNSMPSVLDYAIESKMPPIIQASSPKGNPRSSYSTTAKPSRNYLIQQPKVQQGKR
ncbi:MAG: hypothetical protein AAF623_09540 [Planctomycetota bacterium]